MNEFLVSFIFLLMFMGVVSGAIVDEEIYDNLKNKNEIRVIINLKEPSQEKGFIFKTQKTFFEINLEKQKIIDKIIKDIKKENVRHIFDKRIAVEISKNELNILINNPEIESIKIDRQVKAFLQESVPLINASAIWPKQILGINITGSDETVCVVDTGIDFTHSALSGKNKTCVIDCQGNPCIENCSVGDDNGHGTHVAGIIAALDEIKGVAIGADLIGIKVLDSTGSGSSSDVEAGMNWCISNSNIYNISIISMSLGITYANGSEIPYNNYCDSQYSFDFTPIINNATQNNISVIVASGNTLGAGSITSPACIFNSTAVGSIRKNDLTIDYNRNNLTDLVAPGYSINSTVPIGACANCDSSSYKILWGTSMATPHVAGAFTLIRQFFRLQNNRVPTPSEIEDALNSTGKQIYDASSGLNYSRIDVYSAILSLDADAPNITLVSPTNNKVTLIVNQTFTCNATDWQLANMTLRIWNSSNALYYNATNNLTGTSNETSFNRTNMSEDTYSWNCLSVDVEGNSDSASTNFSLTIGGVSVILLSPSNNTYTNINNTNFSCQVLSDVNNELSNVTFYLWNSSGDLNYSLTTDISNFNNTTIFNFTFVDEGDYSWNCLGVNNMFDESWGVNNFSVTYDITSPLINLSGVANGTSTTIEFSFNVSDLNPVSNCSVYIDGSGTSNTSIINNSGVNTISISGLSVETHNVYVNCNDNSGNVGNSSTISFTISSPPVVAVSTSSGGGGGGGGATIQPQVYVISVAEVSVGYTKSLKNNEKVNFSIFDFEGGRHLLTIKGVGADHVNITIESDPINLTLGIGQSVKLNLTSPNYYDLFVKVNSILNGAAELTIQLINEPIELRDIETTITSTEISEAGQTFVGDSPWVVISLAITSILISVVGLIGLILIKLNRKKLIVKDISRVKKTKKHGKKTKA